MSEPIENWMPLYVREYLADTGRLSTLEHGAYLLLIMDYWVAGPPPDDDKQLSAVARLPLREWRKIRPVLEPFFSVAEGQWRHKRVEEELAGARAVYEARAEAGRRGGKQTASKRVAGLPANGAANGKQTGTPLPLPLPEETNVSSREATVDDEIRTLAESLAVDPAAELLKFSDWKAANGRRFKNDRAAFRNWLRKAAEIAPARPKPINGAPALMRYEEPWAQRFKAYRENGFWHRESYGQPPGHPDCRAPDEFLTPAEIAAKRKAA